MGPSPLEGADGILPVIQYWEDGMWPAPEADNGPAEVLDTDIDTNMMDSRNEREEGQLCDM